MYAVSPCKAVATTWHMPSDGSYRKNRIENWDDEYKRCKLCGSSFTPQNKTLRLEIGRHQKLCMSDLVVDYRYVYTIALSPTSVLCALKC